MTGSWELRGLARVGGCFDLRGWHRRHRCRRGADCADGRTAARSGRGWPHLELVTSPQYVSLLLRLEPPHKVFAPIRAPLLRCLGAIYLFLLFCQSHLDSPSARFSFHTFCNGSHVQLRMIAALCRISLVLSVPSSTMDARAQDPHLHSFCFFFLQPTRSRQSFTHTYHTRTLHTHTHHTFTLHGLTLTLHTRTLHTHTLHTRTLHTHTLHLRTTRSVS